MALVYHGCGGWEPSASGAGSGVEAGQCIVCREFKNSNRTKGFLLSSCANSSKHCGDGGPLPAATARSGYPCPLVHRRLCGMGSSQGQGGNPEGARAGRKPRFLHLINERLLRTQLEKHEPGPGRARKILGGRQLSRG